MASSHWTSCPRPMASGSPAGLGLPPAQLRATDGAPHRRSRTSYGPAVLGTAGIHDAKPWCRRRRKPGGAASGAHGRIGPCWFPPPSLAPAPPPQTGLPALSSPHPTVTVPGTEFSPLRGSSRRPAPSLSWPRYPPPPRNNSARSGVVGRLIRVARRHSSTRRLDRAWGSGYASRPGLTVGVRMPPLPMRWPGRSSSSPSPAR